jgi:hypothetical protein
VQSNDIRVGNFSEDGNLAVYLGQSCGIRANAVTAYELDSNLDRC